MANEHPRRPRRIPRPLRRVLEWPPIERVVATVNRSSVLRNGRLPFLVRELTGSRALVRYRVRASPVPVLLRHGTPDIVTLDEIFYSRDYEMPAEVEGLLARAKGPLRILDVGANVAYFGALMLARYPDAEVVAIEPDPDNAAVIRRAAAHGALGSNGRLIEAAAATSHGSVRFLPGRYSLSRIAGADDAGAIDVEAVDVFDHLADAELVKIDIEGGEWPILSDARLAQIGARALVIEYHREGCSDGDPHDEASRLLLDAGFVVKTNREQADGYGVLWAWKPA